MASLQSRLADLITALGADEKRRHGVYSVPSVGTITPDQNYHQYEVTALAVALAFANPTPANLLDGQSLVFRIKDNGAAKGISWGGNYRAVGLTLPNTTVAGKITYIGAVWNATETKVDVIAIAQEA
jgi:hypothetical protein